MFLEKDNVQSWLKNHKISIPKDLEKEVDIDEYILGVIQYTQKGIDSSLGISYEKTVEFIKEIQSAAGLPF